jgi:NADH-quinone oxidoreductase subunit M
MPWFATAFVVVTLSSIGLPGTNGFVGEFLILSGTWLGRLQKAPVFAALGATGVILGAVYMLWLVERVFYGQLKHPENRGLPDLTLRESVVMVPMIGLIVLMGLAPQPFLEPARPAVDRLIARMATADARLRRDPGLPSRVGTEPPAAVTLQALPGQVPLPGLRPFAFPRARGAD